VVAQGPAIYRLARAFVGDAAADDLAQDVFVAAWRGLPKLRDPDRFGPWLHRVALNRCRSATRTASRVREIPIGPAAEATSGGTDFRAAVEARAVVGPAFHRLPDEARALIALHYAAGLSIRECAETLDIAEGTAKSRLNAALERLRHDVARDER